MIDIYLNTNVITNDKMQGQLSYVPGRVFSYENLWSLSWRLGLTIVVENEIDASTLGGDFIKGSRIPVRIIGQNYPETKLSRIEVYGVEKVTVLASEIPSIPVGSVSEREILVAELQMPGSGIIDQGRVRGKDDFERYQYQGEYAYPLRVRVEFELKKIIVWATEVFYTLSFNMNGGGGNVDRRRWKPGVYFQPGEGFSYTKPSKSGCLFLGWSEDAAAVKPQYPLAVGDRPPKNGGASFPGNKSFTMPERDVTLYAVWWQYTYRPLTKNGVIIRSPSNNLILRDGD